MVCYGLARLKWESLFENEVHPEKAGPDGSLQDPASGITSGHFSYSDQLITLWPYAPELGFVVLALEGSQPNIQPTEQVVLVVKNPPTKAGDVRDAGLILGSGRTLGGGHGNPLQYSCLENPHGQRSLVGYSPWGLHESDTTQAT